MDEISYEPVSDKKEIVLEDKDFMFYTLLTQILNELRRRN